MNERDKELANVIYGSQWTSQDLHFAALIRADEREACADIAENWNSNGSPRVGVAAQIRARGDV